MEMSWFLDEFLDYCMTSVHFDNFYERFHKYCHRESLERGKNRILY